MPHSKQLQLFRKVAFAEGLSYLLLFGLTMPLKYMLDMPLPNKIVGYLHGALFFAYFILLLQLKKPENWSWMTMFWWALASILPFGTFVADAKLIKKY